MNILALETSTKHFSLAVSSGGKVIAAREIELKTVLSDAIIPAIEHILKKSKLTLEKIDGFAVGLGPGSFTSLRVGLSTVKALAFVTKKPVVGISSLDVLAAGVQEKGEEQICTIIDARRNLLYACLFQKKGDALKKKTPYLLCSIDELLKKIDCPTIFVGDGIVTTNSLDGKKEQQVSFVDKKLWYPQAADLARLSEKKFQEKKFDNPETLIPLYLYPDDCQVGKK